MKFCWEYKHS